MRIGGRPRELVAVRIHARNNDERDLLEQFLDRGIGPVTRCELKCYDPCKLSQWKCSRSRRID